MFVHLMVKQLSHKWLSNLLLFVTMAALVSLYVFILNTNRFSVRSMQLIMKDMGLNQFIIPESVPASEIHLCTDRQPEFSDRITQELANHTELLSRYYLSVLQRRTEIGGQQLLLTGIMPVQRPDETQEKGHPVKPVQPGTVRLGFAAAGALDAREGGSVSIMDNPFVVSAVLRDQGTLDDYRIFLNLNDAQNLLGAAGTINAIYSFECLHPGGSLESIHRFQKETLARIIPGFTQVNISNISEGRYYARRMTDKYQYYLLGMVALITVLVFVITGFQEVAERKYETGILVAQGTGYSYIIGLYLCKTLILSAIACVFGFLIGGAASVLLTQPFLLTNTREVSIAWSNLPPTLALICGVALLAELIPMATLVRMDPCKILMEE